MKLTPIQAGFFKLDGGAMFGIVPKSMWNRMNPADENNMCTWCMRCLLVEFGDYKILIDAGMGDKQDEKFNSHFYPHGGFSLLSSLAEINVLPEEITHVFFTHLHFDHDGGAVYRSSNDELLPVFSNAKYITSKSHFDWAMSPNPREKASFLKENFVPLVDLGLMEYLSDFDGQEWLPNIRLFSTFGHTHGMMYLELKMADKNVIFCADVLPSSFHVGLPYVMAYDIFPLKSIEEKELLLTRAVDRGDILFLEHDPFHECCTVKRNDRGRIVLDRCMTLAEALGQ